MAKFFKDQIEPAIVLKAFLDLWESIEMGLLYTLIDFKLIFNGLTIFTGIRLENDSLATLNRSCPFYNFIIPFFDGFDRFVFILDHVCCGIGS